MKRLKTIMEQKLTASVPMASPKTEAKTARITLDQLVNLCIEEEASDIHFGTGSRVALKVGGRLVFIENLEKLTKEEAESMIYGMIPDKEDKERLVSQKELDFSYAHSSGVNFRVNAYFQRGNLTAVMRMISKNLPTMDELGVPPEVKKLLPVRAGLVLVCGAAGSGKSTSIQSMLEYINQNFVEHVITIENPIEYLFEDKKSIFSQREVGKDTLSTRSALRSAVREAPNVIMLSEINDVQTLDEVLTLVETGHLVISSIPTKDTRQTLERLIGLYPQDQQSQAMERLADNLVAILCQELVTRADKPGRAAIYELLVVNSGVRNIIRRGNFAQFKTAMQAGARDGMITMDAYAYQLAEQGVIHPDAVKRFIEEE
ncbi:PilT/PilU family type 4a pilus ATPase [Candidatus Peregrinibacteria bacterium]|nr:PilT/PilU family type 4a pilus ATPase [Candidatus Peregrinibacteria bacterium]